jgi:Leucine-rich repeat (LRR) protein
VSGGAARILELHEQGLTSVPESVGGMVGLEELSLWRNRLRALPDFVWDLTSLRVLNVSENELPSLS